MTLPDLYSGKLLRGSANSGGTGGNESHAHTPSRDVSGKPAVAGGDVGYAMADHVPPYYDVVFIIRVK